MKRVQPSTGKPPPVAFLVGELSSLPSQTPVTRLAVYPMNQASRKSWLVPVLPAAIQPGISALRAVPLSIVSCIMVFIIPTWRGPITLPSLSAGPAVHHLPRGGPDLVTTCSQTPCATSAHNAE